jgi:hypothetical protein
MQEALLHYIWKNALLEQKEYLADTGERIRIIHFGFHNTDAGPDFTEAKIGIEGTLWAGNVEIHTDASDWYRHRHQENPAYNNVILHVVMNGDTKCHTESGRTVPTISLQPDPFLDKKYRSLMESEKKIPCTEELKFLDHSLIRFWLSALAIERLSSRTQAIRSLLRSTNNNWEEAFYIQLARSIGLNINSLPFEMLARSIPIKILQKTQGNITCAEALFFGQAGFLDSDLSDNYFLVLKKEYEYLRKKHALVPMEKHLWKFLRSRPLNFPTIRIAQLAGLLNSKEHLFSQIMEIRELPALKDFLSCTVSPYWNNHYIFGTESYCTGKELGSNTKLSIIINTVVPFLYVFGEIKNSNILKDRALEWLEQIPSEKNQVLKNWSVAGIKARHAADSQALLELYHQYCVPKKCLDCQLGHLVLNTARK